MAEFVDLDSAKSFEIGTNLSLLRGSSSKTRKKAMPAKKRRSSGIVKTSKRFKAQLVVNYLDDLDSSLLLNIGNDAFTKDKNGLVMRFFRFFNSKVFDNKIPAETKINWNLYLEGFAGSSAIEWCTRFTDRGTGKEEEELLRVPHIELSPQVINSASRLRNTLLLEMCTVAAWIIDGASSRIEHELISRQWVGKAQRLFPELPEAASDHPYEKNHKFRYFCEDCRKRYYDWKPLIDINRIICNICCGRLQLRTMCLSEPADFDEFDIPTAFRLYVQENYKRIEEKYPNQTHDQLMILLNAEYQTTKLTM